MDQPLIAIPIDNMSLDVLKENQRKEWLPCQRCGLCCVACLCPVGEEADDGYCKHLSFDDDLSSCALIVNNKMPEGAIGTDGCPLRSCFRESFDGAMWAQIEAKEILIKTRKV